jgi:hypothetical protein
MYFAVVSHMRDVPSKLIPHPSFAPSRTAILWNYDFMARQTFRADPSGHRKTQKAHLKYLNLIDVSV